MNQNLIIEEEKMKALSSIIMGIAHEMNTPLGIGVTAASIIESELKELHNKIVYESPDKKALINSFERIFKSLKLVMSNLNRAVIVVNNFKKTDVSSYCDNLVNFNLSNYINNIADYFQNKDEIVAGDHNIITEIPEDIFIHSYPFVFEQIITGLIDNSLIHGLSGIKGGLIRISLDDNPDSFIFKYKDNGNGSEDNISRKIFEPFFTTKRDQGCIGLGLNIIYNLVVYILKGQIECYSNLGNGLEIEITLVK